MKYFDKRYLVMFSLLLSFAIAGMGCTSTDTMTQSNSNKEPENVIKTKAQNIKLAKIEQQSHNLEKALFYYLQALEIDEEDIEIFCAIGNIQNSLNSPEFAIRAFKQALTINPDHVPALAAVGIYYLEQKNMDKANLTLERTVKLDQQRLNKKVSFKHFIALDNESPLLAYNALAVLSDLNSRHDYAREIFKLLISTSENASLIYTNIGYSYYLSHHYILAENYYKKALDVNSGYERAKLNLGLIYVRTGQYNKSIQLFKQVMTIAEAYNDIGYFLLLDGRYQEAEYFLQNAIDLSPTYFEKGNINLENVKLYLREAKTLPKAAVNHNS